jgi:hypothetical protein
MNIVLWIAQIILAFGFLLNGVNHMFRYDQIQTQKGLSLGWCRAAAIDGVYRLLRASRSGRSDIARADRHLAMVDAPCGAGPGANHGSGCGLPPQAWQ